MVRADDLGRDVNRLYWETDEPVTRLAARLEVSRGTFYNHLRPRPAGASCASCGARLLFRTRSNRDAGEAHCGECGGEQRIGGGSSAQAAAPTAARASASSRAGDAKPVASRIPRIDDLHPRVDGERTQLLMVAVAAAALGVGLLFYSRRR